MRLTTLSILTLCLASIGAGTAGAQTASTLPYDHVHLAAPDQAAAVEWYRKNLGGQLSAEGKDRVTFGKTRFIFLKAEAAKPSAGTAIDHIGFSFADLDAKMRELEAAGVKVVTPVRDVPGLFKLGFIEDPWGVKIEVVQDPETLGFHHVHLRAPDPAVSLAWYQERFGGETAKLKGRIDGLKYGDVWVLVQKGDATPSVGHAIDHVGWRVPDLEKILGDLKAKNIKVLQGPTALTLATGVVHYSFVEDPAGTKIEIVQR
jgi:catechol 2,3-dioxygenase-like lactoylglutathione lyase family enzyme